MDATRMNLGWVTHPGRLAFRFDAMASREGRAIRLRASAAPMARDRVTVDRGGRHHWLQWADGADAFEAFVDDDYDR